jgi:hypothetical protein
MLGAPIKASALVETTVPPGVESMTILFVAVGGICTLKPPVGVSVIALWGVTMPPITSDEMPPEYGPEIVIVAPGAATFGSTALICGDGTTDFYMRLKTKRGSDLQELDGFGFVNGKKISVLLSKSKAIWTNAAWSKH